MATIGTIAVNLVARTSAFDRKMKKSRRNVVSFRQTFNASAASAIRFGTAFAAAGIAIGGAFTFAVRQELKLIDATAKLAKITGDTTEGILKLRHAAILSGSSAETMDKALLKLSARLGEAKLGIGEATDALNVLQLPVKELVSLRPSQAILRIADAVRKLQTQAEKSSVVKDLFGRSGQDFLVLLDEGSKGMKKLGDQLSRNALFSLEQAAAAERFNDAMTNIGASMKGLLTQVALRMSPALAAMAEEFETVDFAAGGLVETLLNLVETLVKLPEFAAGAFDVLKTGFELGQIGARALLIETLKLGVAMANNAEKTKFFAQQIVALEKELAIDAPEVLVKKGLSDQFREFREAIEASIARIRSAAGKAGAPGAAPDADVPPALQAQATAIFAATRTPFEQFAEKLSLLNDLFTRELITRDTANRAWQQAAERLQKSTMAIDPVLQRLKMQAEFLTASMRTPFEELIDTIDDVDKLFAAGLISSETAIRAHDAATKAFENTLPLLEQAREGTFRAIDPRFMSIGGAGPGRQAQRTRKSQLDEARKQTTIFEDIRDQGRGFAA